MPAYPNDTYNLVIYEWAGERSPRQWLDLMVRLLDIVGVPPDLMELVVGDKRKRISSKNLRKKLDEMGSGALTSISANWLEDKKNLSRPTMVIFCNFSARRGVRVHFQKSFKLNGNDLLFRELLDFLEIEYGIIYEMPYDFGPVYYASGIGVTIYDKELNRLDPLSKGEQDNVEEFGRVFVSHNRHEILSRKFRDIYQYNLIGTGHLENTVCGLPLREYISKNQYGRLVQLKDDTFLWTFDDAVPTQCRKDMIEAGLTVSKRWD